MKLTKIGLIAATALSLIFISGCRDNDNFPKTELEMKPVNNSDGEPLQYLWGIYSQCIDGNAYLVGAGSSTSIIQVMDSNNSVNCLVGKENATLRHQNPNRGTYKICAGGYSFILTAEKNDLSIVQTMGKNNKATLCIPNKAELHKELFIHPDIQQKIKEMDAIFTQTENPNNEDKTNKIH